MNYGGFFLQRLARQPWSAAKKRRRPGGSPGLLTNIHASGTLVDITVSGRNAKGESQPTDAVTAAVP